MSKCPCPAVHAAYPPPVEAADAGCLQLLSRAEKAPWEVPPSLDDPATDVRNKPGFLSYSTTDLERLRGLNEEGQSGEQEYVWWTPAEDLAAGLFIPGTDER